MNRLGFTYRQTGHLSFGMWADLFEAYKYQYNFEAKKIMYSVEPEKQDSLLDL